MPQPATKQPSRDKILDCAEALFARRGFAGIGLSEVAEAAGLGKSSLFHHFHSKAQLYAAVMARILGRIETALMRALAEGGTPTGRLERWIDVIIDELAAHRTYARLLLRSLFEDDELAGELPEEQEANAVLRRIVAAGGRLLREGMAAGEFRPASVPHTLQTLIGATVYHFASGDFGDEMIGRPLFSGSEVRRRKSEVKALVRRGLAIAPAAKRPRRIR
ncbi:MAG TPA: TetR/AcrR family transcriptional regulator [Candidatus Binatia bacterium]|jgi:AcrR family transcriptional regulator|nr:TetR/AcrR family transcriptional regulator [Candidatus Binatia bacterium]